MEPTTLRGLMKTAYVACNKRGLTMTVPQSWIVKGEDRLSYATIVRLIECCREYHWQKDILSRIDSRKYCLDSICKSVSCEFISPVLVGTTISIAYRITEVRRKGYLLEFELRSKSDRKVYAKSRLLSVFYDPSGHRAVVPPTSILDYLHTQECSKEVSHEDLGAGPGAT